MKNNWPKWVFKKSEKETKVAENEIPIRVLF